MVAATQTQPQKRKSLSSVFGVCAVLCAGVLLLDVALSLGWGYSIFLPRGRQGEHDAQQSLTASESFVPDAIVYTSFGNKFLNTGGNSVLPVLEASLCSLRSRGQYDGDIVILTDQVAALASLASSYGVKLLAHPPIDAMMRLFALKCQLLDLLPMEYSNVLYLVSEGSSSLLYSR
jgi:hypothetical protein